MELNKLAETNSKEAAKDLNYLIDQVWLDLDGQIPKDQIRRIAIFVSARFEDAVVKTHIPLYVRHFTREWLKAGRR